jgi:hypothetical protein
VDYICLLVLILPIIGQVHIERIGAYDLELDATPRAGNDGSPARLI